MSELGTLFLVVLAIYVFQCIYWVTPGSSIFRLSGETIRARKRQAFVWNVWKIEGILASPLPPLSPLFVIGWPDWQLNRESISFAMRGGVPTSLPWNALRVTYSDSRLFCNGSPVFKGSEGQVLGYVQLLQRLATLKAQQREPMIEKWLRHAMNRRVAARKLALFRGESWWLRILANLQFFLLFVVLPLALREAGPRALWPSAGAIAVASVAITLEFWMVHKALFEEARQTRFKMALTVLLSPISAIRACDGIARDLLSGCHPLAVASAGLARDEVKNIAGEELRKLRFGQCADSWYQKTLDNFIEQAARQAGLQPEELLRPSKQESGCTLYCPRCLAQYAKQRNECADCGYSPLIIFANSTEES